MKAGKSSTAKPMIHYYTDGPKMIEAARSSGRILQIGSQRVSPVIYAKAKELLAAGAIGQLNMVTAWWDRNSSIGAFNSTIPLGASTETCDWPRFLGVAPRIGFTVKRFFQWRKWQAYGSGVAGESFRPHLQRNSLHHRVQGTDARHGDWRCTLLQGQLRCAGHDAGAVRLSSRRTQHQQNTPREVPGFEQRNLYRGDAGANR